MKIFLTFTILFISCFLSRAQDIERMVLKNKEPKCEDIAEASSKLFANYIATNDIDSAEIVLEYWRSKCEGSEPTIRARILMDMIAKQSIEELLDQDFSWYIYNFMNRTSINMEQYDAYSELRNYLGYVAPAEYFDEILKVKFEELLDSLDPGTDKYLLAQFYAGQLNSLFREIQKKDYADSKLRKIYDEEVQEVKQMKEAHIAWITGVWVPTNELKTLGTHPDLGFLLGWKKGKWNYDLILSFKFLKAKNEYAARRKSANTTEMTDHFFGGQIGFEIGRDILSRGPHELQLIGGLAFDGIDVLEEDEDNGLDAQSANSYNANIGLGYRFYTNGNFYLGLKARYNIIDYTLSNVTDLKGNAFTFHFVIGSVKNLIKSNRLTELQQEIRR